MEKEHRLHQDLDRLDQIVAAPDVGHFMAQDGRRGRPCDHRVQAAGTRMRRWNKPHGQGHGDALLRRISRPAAFMSAGISAGCTGTDRRSSTYSWTVLQQRPAQPGRGDARPGKHQHRRQPETAGQAGHDLQRRGPGSRRRETAGAPPVGQGFGRRDPNQAVDTKGGMASLTTPTVATAASTRADARRNR